MELDQIVLKRKVLLKMKRLITEKKISSSNLRHSKEKSYTNSLYWVKTLTSLDLNQAGNSNFKLTYLTK